MHICIRDLVAVSTSPHIHTSTPRCGCQSLSARMHVDESRLSPALSTAYVKVVGTYVLTLCGANILCVVMQVGQTGSCRRAYGRKIAVLYRPALLRCCLF
jgi:hypothetical protein